jgi:hypothetical protein
LFKPSGVLAFLLSVGIAGCSMITTEYLGDTREPVREGTVAYSLPMTLVKLAILRREMTGDPGPKRRGGKGYEYDIADFGDREACRERICSEVLTVPDPRHNYVVKFRGSILSDDTLTLQVSDKGYLTSADGTAVDRTGDIIVGATRLALGDVADPKLHSRRDAVVEFVEWQTVDPHNPEQMAMVNRRLRQFGLEVGCEGACSPPAAPVREPSDEVYFRLKRTIFLVVRDLGAGTMRVHPVLSFNGSPLVAQRIERAPFVSRETQLAWSEGMPQKALHKKPSEALGLVTVAGNVAGAVVYAPINAITQQTAQTNKQKDYLAAREALLDQRLRMMEKEAEYTSKRDSRLEQPAGVAAEPPSTGSFNQ